MAFKVLDSENIKVGDFISLNGGNGSATVALKVTHKDYIVQVFPDRIGDQTSMDILYTSNNCSGQGYVAYNTQNSIYELWQLTSIGWISTAPFNITPTTITVLSYKSTSDNVCHEPSESYEISVVPLVIGPNLASGFTPPFRFTA